MNAKIIHKMTIIFLSAFLLMPYIQADAKENEVTVYVTSLKVRSGPGLTYDTIGSVTKNDKLNVIGKENDWLQINFGNTTGWVASWYTTKESLEFTNKQIISKVNRLNVRTEPTTSSAVIGQLQEGDSANAYRSQADWIEIDFQGRKGWINQSYITVTEQTKNKDTSLPSNENIFEVSVNALNVRSKADLTSKKIGMAYKGDQFTVLDSVHNWVKVELENGDKGWLYSFYGTLSSPATTKSVEKNGTITILYNGTNLRSESTTNSEVITRADAGTTFQVAEKVNDWYKVIINNQTAYVASWLVSASSTTSNIIETMKDKNKVETENKKDIPRKKGTLKGLTIVIDAGHGGNDRGTTGALGTDEKDITLITSELLSSKLQAAGANVILTRESDEYVDLRKRVSIGHQVDADAFISLHYDAIDNSSVRGFTTYYMHSYQKELAKYVHNGLSKMVSLKDRGTQPGDYLVLRENRQKAILIELGYLSNPSEERNVTTQNYREQATHGIYNGIINYFDAQLD
ncbi:N-acetylmuramoyl-L-alanine amidase [Psychrobacillus sp. OK028]|uniref:SH3 domain-containing protein n=1 Tax=Psychrobacillus sp. OK028 TaxID=1884359 RepID=UPI00088D560A|nr:SH3 domain-containing protein [Psychrobacillus sp. OK028]SDM81716.1 N-acetylmuramoyl-L-alanine amidase [Psychrobacillus sp. OK028]